MNVNNIDLTQEFSNPDVNFVILLNEMETELKLIQLDLTNIQSPILKGLAQKEYLRLKEKYFYLLAKDLTLLKLYEINNENEQDDEGYSPM